jgi:hypothetical protein
MTIEAKATLFVHQANLSSSPPRNFLAIERTCRKHRHACTFDEFPEDFPVVEGIVQNHPQCAGNSRRHKIRKYAQILFPEHQSLREFCTSIDSGRELYK